MRIAVLGELLVLDGGRDVTPSGRRSKDLLAALLLRRGQGVEPAVLLDQVWGPGAAGLSVAVVHTQVARLRRALGAGAVLRTNNGYRLGPAELDSDRFTELVSRARGRGPGRAVPLLREALGLWRSGQPFSDVGQEIVGPEVARLVELRTLALERLGEDLASLPDAAALEEALLVAGQLMQADPLRERGYEIAMTAAAAAGRRSDALLCFERLRVTLREALGIDPGPRAQQLHLELLRTDGTVAPVRAAPDGPAAAPPPPAPPAPRTRSVGRSEDLARVLELLRTRRIVTVTGLGGVGKTRLATEVWHGVGPGLERVYLDLAGHGASTPEEVAEDVGLALGLALGAQDPLGTVAAAIGDRRLLLVLDEAEHDVATVAGLVRGLLDRCPRLTVLATSRRPLGVIGEAVHPLAPLVCPAVGADAARSREASAVALLGERILDHAPGLVMDDPTILRLAEFARQVDGLPLALELLAAHAATRSVDELAMLVASPLDLASHEPDRSWRHRTLHATIAWSVDRLPEEQRTVLYRLAVFVGSFHRPAAQLVCGPDVDVDQGLRALVREALVHTERVGGSLAYRLPRPVRDLAHDRLAATGDLARVVARHRALHAGTWRGALRSDALLLDVRRHHADYLAALRDAHDVGDGRAVVDLTLTLSRLWIFTDMLGPGLRWTGRALASGLLSPLEEARVTTMRAALLQHHAPEVVSAELAGVIPVLTQHDDAAWLVSALMIAGVVRTVSGDHAGALEHARAAVVAARRTTEERQADAWGVLASCAAPLAPEEALDASRQAWALVSRSGSVFATASVAGNLAWAQLAMGAPDAAADVVTQALERLGPDEVPTFLRLHHAWTSLLTGHPEVALEEFDRVVSAGSAELEDRKTAGVYLGAACALAALRHPAAPDVLEGAVALGARTGLVLLAVQEEAVRRARDGLAGLPAPSWTAALAPGRELARLIRSAAHDRADPGRPGPAPEPPDR
ncbi:BTAD domain-containing putative transcriptional regulator [Kineosporia sp. R_H_3]|uniref:ATP-binding protein n=1 Tax=Kineosporia sp. R_H_3 TaxID=1961848 RepID=UPI000B4BE166|nr:BTAD domain-containing putative transcriptional regulator [Kineosporia sp. R_H_3]